MKIRIAKRVDLPAIVEIYNQAIRERNKTADLYEYTVAERIEWFNSHTDSKYPLFVAEDENGIVGYSSISPYRESRPALLRTAELSYYVHFEHHRKGIGSKLVNWAIGYSSEKG